MRVRLFAALRELAGAGMVEVDAPDVATLLERLSAGYGPEFARILQAGSVVVDGDVVKGDRPLRPDQEVAVLPPVSGG